MSISRKEFMFRGILAFGRDLVENLMADPSPAAQENSIEEHRYLLLDNKRCLAQRGGCFACIDHCPTGAVSIALGKGVAIEDERCDGCGECAAVCPIVPEVITIKSSKAESTTFKKGEMNEEDRIDSCCSGRSAAGPEFAGSACGCQGKTG